MAQPLRYIACGLLGYYVFAAQFAHADLVIEIYGKPYSANKAPQKTHSVTNESSDDNTHEEENNGSETFSEKDQDTAIHQPDVTSDNLDQLPEEMKK